MNQADFVDPNEGFKYKESVLQSYEKVSIE